MKAFENPNDCDDVAVTDRPPSSSPRAACHGWGCGIRTRHVCRALHQLEEHATAAVQWAGDEGVAHLQVQAWPGAPKLHAVAPAGVAPGEAGTWGDGPASRLLLIFHGWPGSVTEYTPLLKQMQADKEGPGWVVAAVGLPGYGLSEPLGDSDVTGHLCSQAATADCAFTPYSVEAVARYMVALADSLCKRHGLSSWSMAGGDWGAIIATRAAQLRTAQRQAARAAGQPLPTKCEGLHLSFMPASPSTVRSVARLAAGMATHAVWGGESYWPLTEREVRQLSLDAGPNAQVADALHHGGYMLQQATFPETVGTLARLSPAAHLTWILDKMHVWSGGSAALQQDAATAAVAVGGVTLADAADGIDPAAGGEVDALAELLGGWPALATHLLLHLGSVDPAVPLRMYRDSLATSSFWEAHAAPLTTGDDDPTDQLLVAGCEWPNDPFPFPPASWLRSKLGPRAVLRLSSQSQGGHFHAVEQPERLFADVKAWAAMQRNDPSCLAT